MINVENDCKTVTFEQPFHSHIYENQLDYHTRPKSSNIPIEQIVNDVTTIHEPEKEQAQITFTKIYQKTTKRKNLDNPLSFRNRFFNRL